MFQRISVFAAALLAVVLVMPIAAHAQLAPPRTLAELKAEIQLRADHQAYPETGFKADDVRAALPGLTDLAPETWARVWTPLGDRYAKAGDFWQAYLYYDFARWPARSSPGKAAAYDASVAAFVKYAATLDPVINVVKIPFEGKTITAYYRLPKNATGKVPLVLTIGALDEWKEKSAMRWADLTNHGMAELSVDMPGTGQAPILIDAHAERMFSAMLDWVATRPEIDASRVAVIGVSWSSYWAAKLGFVEKARLRGVVSQAPIADKYFSTGWQNVALGTREYLFDLFAARSAVYGVKTMDAFLAFGPTLSLIAQGYIGKPSTPMLLVNGVKDTQVPIDDLFLLLRTGTPKDAWVNPDGNHTGHSADWPDYKIANTVIIPWLERLLK
jgi:hypothetical protein